ncbi:MAG: metallophosphoesterase [Saprospiraceae bacterium]|nr:metallophosphoesterase [Saprospiraceae bacterium]
MKIQYCSDLHLEFKENKKFLEHHPIQPSGEILLLAGDITLFKQIEEQNDFFDFLSDHFEAVYWIPGNHEYYYWDLAGVQMPLFKKIRENVFLVNNQVVVYKEAELILSTLWSHIPPQREWIVQQNMSDFALIKNNGLPFTATDFNALHQSGLDFVRTALSIPSDRHRIVITHHVPTFMHYPEEYRNSPINCGFATELYDFIEESQVTYWIYGHHHSNVPAFKIGNTSLVTNQLGYLLKKENWLFSPAAVLEI